MCFEMFWTSKCPGRVGHMGHTSGNLKLDEYSRKTLKYLEFWSKGDILQLCLQTVDNFVCMLFVYN